MDPRHQEYIEYYKVRLSRAESNPLFPRTAAAERALFEAIRTASSLEEFGEREAAGRLSLACAVARAQDEATAEANFYLELEESVRAQPHLEVLRRLQEEPPDSVEQLNALVSATLDRWNLEISGDEMLRDTFWNDWKILEDIECLEQADVPERWRAENRELARRELERGAQHFREHTLPEIRKFVPDYQPDYQGLQEVRHRRRFPVSDAVFNTRVDGHRRYVGAK